MGIIQKISIAVVVVIFLFGCTKIQNHKSIVFNNKNIEKNSAKTQLRHELLKFLKDYSSTFHPFDPIHDWTKSLASNTNYLYTSEQNTTNGEGTLYIYQKDSNSVGLASGKSTYFYIFFNVGSRAVVKLYSWGYWFSGGQPPQPMFSITLSDSRFCYGHSNELPTISDDSWILPSNEANAVERGRIKNISCMGGGRDFDHSYGVATQAAGNAYGSLPGYTNGDSVITFKDERSMQDMANLVISIYHPEIFSETFVQKILRTII